MILVLVPAFLSLTLALLPAPLPLLPLTPPQIPHTASAHAVRLAVETTPGARLWLSPLNGTLRISRPFSLPNGPYQAGHRGIDLPAVEGAIVHAPNKGVISFAGAVVDRPVMSIQIDERTIVSLEPVISDFEAGYSVGPGQAIGSVGRGGDCDRACVHLGVRVDGEYVNPLRFFLSRPELQPW